MSRFGQDPGIRIRIKMKRIHSSPIRKSFVAWVEMVRVGPDGRFIPLLPLTAVPSWKLQRGNCAVSSCKNEIAQRGVLKIELRIMYYLVGS